MRYVPTDGFETFPFPRYSEHITRIGAEYDAWRRAIFLKHQEGLTQTYNRFHDKKESVADIKKLRELHVKLDQTVAAAYGWDDIELAHGFHMTKPGERFTISETARREVLQRLLKLNHERYAEEVKQGLHEKKGKTKQPGAGKGRRKTLASGPNLFGDDDEEC
jgi:hypothetical protein